MKTVKVRIAVACKPDGKYVAFGVRGTEPGESAEDFLSVSAFLEDEDFRSGVTFAWVEAEVPVREEQVVQAKPVTTPGGDGGAKEGGEK